MKPEETGSATGDLRYRTLKEMYRIVTEHGLKLETISSWALAVLGLGGGFLIANIDKVEKHMNLCSRHCLFLSVFISGLLGVGIKFIYFFIQFDLNVEADLFSYFDKKIKALEPLNSIADIKTHFVNLVAEEFLASRPLPFRLLARYFMKRTKEDILYLPKNAAKYTQWMMILLIFQVSTLAVAGTLIAYWFIWRHGLRAG